MKGFIRGLFLALCFSLIVGQAWGEAVVSTGLRMSWRQPHVRRIISWWCVARPAGQKTARW